MGKRKKSSRKPQGPKKCAINTLTEAIDVYSEWVDAADAVAKEAANDRSTGSTSFTRPSARAPIADREVDDDEDERRYEGEGIVADDDDY
ncbi:hypothetical protein ONZ43_g2820 [Nemania bipapillata]|uniref:Uncharacterized protein n=1 Tax=Nemania bipapillata TaxID=110536 RepID=A0ACC2IZV5_9PEZI|nr:hypothetical protein ONZ43_g2820 [Nemania bipapillata]